MVQLATLINSISIIIVAIALIVHMHSIENLIVRPDYYKDDHGTKT